MSTYATLPQVKAAAGLTDPDDDAALELALESASRTVDGICERRFYTAGTEVRYYVPQTAMYVDTDDIAGTAIAVATSSGVDGTYDTPWTDADWQAEPLNRTNAGLTFPVTRLRATNAYLFPSNAWGQASVRVTAVFGWDTVPNAVTYATILLALRQWQRFKSPMGIVGYGDMGAVRVSRTDPDVAALLAPYRRHPIGFA